MVYQALDESGAPLQADYKNLKLSELSRSRLRFEYETVDLLPKVEVASSSLVTRSKAFSKSVPDSRTVVIESAPFESRPKGPGVPT